ncbi:MAG: transporter substrate-binding domain-containing protein [Myxococcales bacterium]|nr:transporter substrate-binding domain-containing protein [Myxococcales bacterium]
MPLVVAIDYAFPPQQWIDDKGEAGGCDVEVFRAVAAEIGLEYEICGATWDQVRGQLERGVLFLMTDLQLPGLWGLELTRKVLDEFPAMGVIFLSGHPGPLDLPRGARVRFVPKPFTGESFAEALKSLAGREPT